MVFGWIFFSFVVGFLGMSRKIGFWSSFFLSLLLSPLIGVLFVFNSDKKDDTQKHHLSMIRLVNKGDEELKRGNIDRAISIYTDALAYNEKAPHTHFKLSRLYSTKLDVYSSLKHLELAVKTGFKDLDSIKHHPDLDFVRSTEHFNNFVRNGYKIENTKDLDAQKTTKFESLEKLSSLYEKGVLTQEEFELEKKKILSKDE